MASGGHNGLHPGRAPGPDPTAGGVPPRPRPAAGPVDALMLLLAVISIGLILYLTFGHVSDGTRRLIYGIDFTICAVFAVDFLWRWRRQGWGIGYPLRNWYDLLGMIPVAVLAWPFLRMLRLVRVVVLLVRFGGLLDRIVGDGFTFGLVNRAARPIVMAVRTPITLAVLEEVAVVLKAGTYSQNLAFALDENSAQLGETILQGLENDPQIGVLRHVPFHEPIVQGVTAIVLRVMTDVLEDRRTDETIADFMRNNVDQIRRGVEARQGEIAKSGHARGAYDSPGPAGADRPRPGDPRVGAQA